MAPKSDNQWVEHGWWLTTKDLQKPTLCVTKYPIQDGKHWSALGKYFGILQKISMVPNGVIYAHMSSEDS